MGRPMFDINSQGPDWDSFLPNGGIPEFNLTLHQSTTLSINQGSKDGGSPLQFLGIRRFLRESLGCDWVGSFRWKFLTSLAQ